MLIILSIKLNFEEAALMKIEHTNKQVKVKLVAAQNIIIALLSKRT